MVFDRAREHIDVLDLLHRILETGFMGTYRSTLKGPRVLEDIRRKVEDRIMTVRRLQADEAEGERANAAPVPNLRPSYVKKWDWVHFVLLEIVPLVTVPALVAIAIWWAIFRGNLSS